MDTFFSSVARPRPLLNFDGSERRALSRKGVHSAISDTFVIHASYVLCLIPNPHHSLEHMDMWSSSISTGEAQILLEWKPACGEVSLSLLFYLVALNVSLASHSLLFSIREDSITGGARGR